MTPYSSQRSTTLRLILALLFASSACTMFQPAVPSTTIPQPGADSTTTPQPGADSTTTLQPGAPATATLQPGGPATTTPQPGDQTIQDNHTFEAEVTFGPGAFNFPDPRAGVSDLSSYKATLTLAFEGTNGGQPYTWSKTYVMLVTREPAARQMTIEKTGDLSNLDGVFMAEMDGADYERRGESSCVANAIAEGYSLGERMEPAGFLTVVIGADEAGSEPVNGVAARHSTFDERAIGQSGIAKSTGEMWVASDGGYVLKYLLTTHGNADYFGDGIEGTLTWDYALSDINQPLAIELPQDCPAGMVDAPLMPDAAEVVNMPGLLSFTTASSVAEAIAFYQQALPALGWQPTADPVLTETEAWQDFTRANQKLSVVITTGDAGTTVDVVLGNK